MEEHVEFLHGILIYNLPITKKEAAILYLRGRKELSAITHVIEDLIGIKVFFNDYGPAGIAVKERFINIDNVPYAVYPAVTNLTVHRIRPFFRSNDEFRQHIREWEPIINVYPVQEATENSQSLFETDDFRVILNTPEVPELLRIPRVVKVSNFEFEVSLFCRLCRQENHAQCNCPNVSEQWSRNAETCFSPIKTPTEYHVSHNSRNKIDVPNAPVLEKDFLKKILLTVKQNEQLAKGNEIQCGSLKTTVNTVKQEQHFADSRCFGNESHRETSCTVKQKEEQLNVCFVETNQQNRSFEKVKKELQSSCCENYQLTACAVKKNHNQESAEGNFFHENPKYNGSGYSHHSACIKQNVSEPSTSLGMNHNDSKLMMHRNWKASSFRSQENVSTVANHRSTLPNKSEMTRKSFSASTSLTSIVQPDGFSKTYESTYYPDDHFKENLEGLKRKTSMGENSSRSFDNEFSRCSSRKLSGTSSVTSNSSWSPTQHQNVSTSLSTRNQKASTSHLSTQNQKALTSCLSTQNPKALTSHPSTQNQKALTSHPSTQNQKASTNRLSTQNQKALTSRLSTENQKALTSRPSTQNQKALTSRLSTLNQKALTSQQSTPTTNTNLKANPIQRTANKRSINSSTLENSDSTSASAKPQVQVKRNNVIRFKLLMPPDCNISEENLRSFCIEGNKSDEAFKKSIVSGPTLMHSEIQKVLAFNNQKSRLNLLERKFIERLEKAWIKLNHYVTTATDVSSHREAPKDTRSSPSSKDDENLVNQKGNSSIWKNISHSKIRSKKQIGKLTPKKKETFQRKKSVGFLTAGKKRFRLNGTSKSTALPETEENGNKLSMVISPGLENAIKKAKGVLMPDEMQHFLIQVYKRVHCVKIALYFSDDVSGICRQLNAIREAYYRSGSRSAKDDLNMRIILGLTKRMKDHAKCESCLKD